MYYLICRCSKSEESPNSLAQEKNYICHSSSVS